MNEIIPSPEPPGGFIRGLISMSADYELLYLLVVAVLAYSCRRSFFGRTQPAAWVLVSPLLLSAAAVYFRLFYAYEGFETHDYRLMDSVISSSRTLLLWSAGGTALSFLLPLVGTRFRPAAFAEAPLVPEEPPRHVSFRLTPSRQLTWRQEVSRGGFIFCVLAYLLSRASGVGGQPFLGIAMAYWASWPLLVGSRAQRLVALLCVGASICLAYWG